MPQRDYILGLIEQVGQFLRGIAALREAGHPDMAVQAVIGSIERLFGLSVEDVASLDVESLFAQLTREENASNARDKCLAFAALNNQAGLAFAEKDLPALAQPAFHMALVFSLKALTAFPRSDLPAFAPDVPFLRHQLEGFELPPATLGLLAAYEQSLPQGAARG
jgi:hypothetical protein